MSGMLRFKSVSELPQTLRSRLKDTFAKHPVETRSDPDPDKPSASFELYCQLVAAGYPTPIREYHFDEQEKEGRHWAFDLAWPELRFAVEVDGMVHRIKQNFKRDIVRHQSAYLASWNVFRVSPSQVASGEAIVLVGMALGLAQKAQERLAAGG